MDLSQAVEELNSLLEQRQQASELINSIEDGGDEQGDMRKLVDDLDEAIRIQYELIQQLRQPKQSDRYRAGDPVMIMSGDAYHVGIVVKSQSTDTEHSKEPLFECYMLGTEPSNTFTVDSSKLAPFRDPPMELVTQGTRCLAVYDQDHHFYECVIDDVDTENREVTVTFTGYGNVQKCPLTHIRLIEHPEIYSHSALQQQQHQTPDISQIASSSSSSSSSKAATPSTEIPVVDHIEPVFLPPVASQQQEEGIVETIPLARSLQTVTTAASQIAHMSPPPHIAETHITVSSANEPKKKKKKKKESKSTKQGIEKQQKWRSFISSGKRGIRKSESIFSSPNAPDTGVRCDMILSVFPSLY